MTELQRRSTFLMALAIVFAEGTLQCFHRTAHAQQTVVSPQQYADAEAPDAADLSGFPAYRFQQVYSADDFSLLGPGPVQISRIDWRPDGEVAEPMIYSGPSWLLRMSTTQKDVSELSTTFAENIGPDELVVVDREVTLTTDNQGPSGGPKLFDYGVDFNPPFTFDPSKGNLLMDLTVKDAQGPLLLDFSFAPTLSTNFQWTGTLGSDSPIAATTQEEVGGPFGGHAIQFTIVPEPAAGQLLSLGVVIGMICRPRRSVRQR